MRSVFRTGCICVRQVAFGSGGLASCQKQDVFQEWFARLPKEQDSSDGLSLCKKRAFLHQKRQLVNKDRTAVRPKVNRNRCDVILNPASGRDPDARPAAGVEFIGYWMYE